MTISEYKKENERLYENNKQMQVEMVLTWRKHDELQKRIDKAIKEIREPVICPLDDAYKTAGIFMNKLKYIKYLLQGEDNEKDE